MSPTATARSQLSMRRRTDSSDRQSDWARSADRHVYALDLVSGAAKWNVEVGGTPTMPVVIDGRVFVGTDLGKVVAIDQVRPDFRRRSVEPHAVLVVGIVDR